ncbi:MAG: hypothetical protein O7E52_25545 [Candidatus Poribacteria bacterium]|nr:hypothetical protein [Candidatus Poribacteria bacterium]
MIEFITEWVKFHWLWVLIFSVITIIGSLVGVSALMISLPPDYFTRKKHVSSIRHPILRVFLHILKNTFGVAALIAGFIMLFTPGQGILTVFVGVILCDFPGKRNLERKLIGRPFLLSTVNRIRLRYNRPPIVLNDDFYKK